MRLKRAYRRLRITQMADFDFIGNYCSPRWQWLILSLYFYHYIGAWTFSEQVKASIIDDSRCGMSDVVFRTAPPISGFFLVFHNDEFYFKNSLALKNFVKIREFYQFWGKNASMAFWSYVMTCVRRRRRCSSSITKWSARISWEQF